MVAFDRAEMLAGDPTGELCLAFGMETLLRLMALAACCQTRALMASPHHRAGAQPVRHFTAGEFGDRSRAMRCACSASTLAARRQPVQPSPEGVSREPAGRSAFDPRVVPTTAVTSFRSPLSATTAHYLDALNDRLMFRLAYRNFLAAVNPWCSQPR